MGSPEKYDQQKARRPRKNILKRPLQLQKTNRAGRRIKIQEQERKQIIQQAKREASSKQSTRLEQVWKRKEFI